MIYDSESGRYGKFSFMYLQWLSRTMTCFKGCHRVLMLSIGSYMDNMKYVD